MGVIADDFDANGHVDFYVANDGTDNLLWINDGAGRFTDTALDAGAAVNGAGTAEASTNRQLAPRLVWNPPTH